MFFCLIEIFRNVITEKSQTTITSNDHPSLQFMQQQRKFEGKIPKISHQQKSPSQQSPIATPMNAVETLTTNLTTLNPTTSTVTAAAAAITAQNSNNKTIIDSNSVNESIIKNSENSSQEEIKSPEENHQIVNIKQEDTLETQQTIAYINNSSNTNDDDKMLPAVTTLNGIPSHHQPQYITMQQAATTTLSPSTHTTTSPSASSTDGPIYQYKSEIICDSQTYQQHTTSTATSHEVQQQGEFLKKKS